MELEILIYGPREQRLVINKGIEPRPAKRLQAIPDIRKTVIPDPHPDKRIFGR